MNLKYAYYTPRLEAADYVSRRHFQGLFNDISLVREGGLEPPRFYSHAPQLCGANFRASNVFSNLGRFEQFADVIPLTSVCLSTTDQGPNCCSQNTQRYLKPWSSTPIVRHDFGDLNSILAHHESHLKHHLDHGFGGSMAHRLTDTTKWDDDWFLSLPPKLKCLWWYLTDTCDGAGLKKVSLRKFSENIGETITREEIDKHFASRVHWVNDELLWIHGFIKAQYKKLTPHNRAHVNIAHLAIRNVSGQTLSLKAQGVFDQLRILILDSDSIKQPPVRGSDEGRTSLIEKGIKNKEKNKGGVGGKIVPVPDDPAFMHLLSAALWSDIRLKEAHLVAEVKNLIMAAFENDPPAFVKAGRDKFHATVWYCYHHAGLTVQDFRNDLNAIINETRSTRSENPEGWRQYVATRIQNQSKAVLHASRSVS